MHRFTFVSLVLLQVLLAPALRAATLEEVAAAFAPVLRQDTANDQDYISAFDFDGDWDGGNNWENQDDYPLRAVVYWAATVTRSHVYLNYSWFHPRDYSKYQRIGNLIGKSGAHENDLEGCWLVLERRDGKLVPVVMETIFHREYKKYVLDRAYALREGFEPGGETVRFEGRHPIVEAESHGHGVTAWDGEDFPGGDGVVYRIGETSEVPEHQDDRDVRYTLVDVRSTFWAHRHSMGEGGTFGKDDEFFGARFGYAFRGFDYGKHKANAPWGWTDEHSEVPRGTLFLDPARLLAHHYEVPGPHFRTYLVNPYMDDIVAETPALQLSLAGPVTTVSAPDDGASGGVFGN